MSNSVSETSLSADILRYIRYQLRGRRGLVVAAVALGVPALWFGWPWLVVAGIAPILLAVAPCAIMCALGLCAMRAGPNANHREASGSNLNSGEASCCSQSQSVDDTVVSMTASKPAARPAEPVAAAVPPQASVNSVEDESEGRPEDTGQSGETINREKEKFQ